MHVCTCVCENMIFSIRLFRVQLLISECCRVLQCVAECCSVLRTPYFREVVYNEFGSLKDHVLCVKIWSSLYPYFAMHQRLQQWFEISQISTSQIAPLNQSCHAQIFGTVVFATIMNQLSMVLDNMNFHAQEKEFRWVAVVCCSSVVCCSRILLWCNMLLHCHEKEFRCVVVVCCSGVVCCSSVVFCSRILQLCNMHLHAKTKSSSVMQ